MLNAQGKVQVGDCDLLYESTFLTALTLFEDLLEELLLTFVTAGSRGKKGHYALLSVRSHAVVRNLLYGRGKYVDMLPMATAREHAARYLNEARPFSEVDEVDQALIADAMKIRNAIAHRSAYAMTQFRTKVAGVTSLPAHRRFPGALLRRQYRAFPTSTWADLYLDTLEKVALKLARDW